MFLRYRAAQAVGTTGVILKGLCIIVADLGLCALVVILAIRGHWGDAIALLVIGIPIATWIIDVATGVVLAGFMAVAALIGWRAREPWDP